MHKAIALHSFTVPYVNKKLNYMRRIIITLTVISFLNVFAQTPTKDSLSFIFIGDIMGHDTQIQSAYNEIEYNYHPVFEKIAPVIKNADFAIANLEVTLAGKPYTGYPQFSSPDALAIACKDSGIDVLVTANNHSCDRGKTGILRTIEVLDSLQIPHTGTFKNVSDKENNNLLLFHKNNIKVGLLNYTYGTNGLKTPYPTIVNRIDSLKMIEDINHAKRSSIDKLIVFLHWGKEYESYPSKNQVKVADFLFNNGVDIVIGSHPHVLQPMKYIPKTADTKEHLVAYSLGNFVSNQRTRKRDGGAIFKLVFTKENEQVTLSNLGYYLTWVHKPKVNGKTIFQVIPCATYEANNFEGMGQASKEKMKLFIKDSRALLNTKNLNVSEITQ